MCYEAVLLEGIADTDRLEEIGERHEVAQLLTDRVPPSRGRIGESLRRFIGESNAVPAIVRRGPQLPNRSEACYYSQAN